MTARIIHGDCLEILPTLEENSIDSCVTDPPYGLSFMGREWDHGVPGVQFWKEVYRVLKPGGHLLAMGGTRTYFRLGCAIDDAGFEVRDTVLWLYGVGFPKSQNVSKAIDRAAGVEREVIGPNPNAVGRTKNITGGNLCSAHDQNRDSVDVITAPATDEAKQWDGWGTALKPAHEPIVLARKPLSEKTVAKNVLRWGTGALNIGACRVTSEPRPLIVGRNGDDAGTDGYGSISGGSKHAGITETGRWPANVCTDGSEEVVDAFPDSKSCSSPSKAKPEGQILGGARSQGAIYPGETSSAARFFQACPHDDADESLCGICCLPYKQETVNVNSCNANNAPSNSSTENIQNEGSVHLDVVDSLPHANKDMNPPLSLNASNAENNSSLCHPQTKSIAPTSARDLEKEQIVQNVKSAGNLCDSCATNIARALVEVRHNQSGASLRFQDFISGHNAQILIQNLVQYVEGRENTDTILTTANLKVLLGSVFHAIANTMDPITDTPKVSKEKSKRFWYSSKASKRDRCGSIHPTIKPISLMRWLARLITPPNGTVLDPFAGSGTTGAACEKEGFNCILIEREADYIADIKRRMNEPTTEEINNLTAEKKLEIIRAELPDWDINIKYMQNEESE